MTRPLPILALVLPLLALGAPRTAWPGGSVTLHLFYAERCSACAQEEEFLARLRTRVPELEVRAIEIDADPRNGPLLAAAAALWGVRVTGVPVAFVGPFAPVLGWDGEETTGRLIEERVRTCVAVGCGDPVAAVLDGGAAGPIDAAATVPGIPDAPEAAVVKLPVLGETDLSGVPIVGLTLVLGALDGFNPCAFFVLFTLLGIMVHARSRARMLAVGGTFVLCSGVLYFVFMAAWLNLFLHLGELRGVTAAAGAVALVIAAVNIKDYFLFRRGVSLTIPESAKPGLFRRMRGLLAATSVPAMLLGTAVLALAANAYELLCTAGFPMVYTRVLTLSGLAPAQHYLLLALYNAVYVLPLAAVVAVFAATLGARKLTEEQGRVMKLVSGVMMLGLGLVVLIEPSLLNSMAAGAGLLAGSLLATAAVVGGERALRAARRRGRPAGVAGGPLAGRERGARA